VQLLHVLDEDVEVHLDLRIRRRHMTSKL
jgi:hypothetical protein